MVWMAQVLNRAVDSLIAIAHRGGRKGQDECQDQGQKRGFYKIPP